MGISGWPLNRIPAWCRGGRAILATVSICAVLLAAIAPAHAQSDTVTDLGASGSKEAACGRDFVPGEVIVKFKTGVRANRVQDTMKASGFAPARMSITL
jgi:hypothetical protein